jgi:hypothetical protein
VFILSLNILCKNDRKDIVVIELNSVKRYKYSVKTLYIDDNITINRTTQNNALYIYVYDKKFLILGLKVTVRE